MRISFISIDNGILAIGFRKVAAVARSMYPDAEVCYVAPSGVRSFFRLLLKRDEITADLSDIDLEKIGSHLSKADMVCFSSMTPFAQVTKKIIKSVREANPGAFIVWGGIHPIIDPEDAIQWADAVCVGEGETAFQNFITGYANGKDYTSTGNFWFNVKGKIIRNGFLPLHRPEEMERFPLPVYADNELIYKKEVGFVPLGLNTYLLFNDLSYHTVWTIGCPHRCNYCSNTRFIENDQSYMKLRHPSVDYIIAEIKKVISRHPHISLIHFHDDSFMSLPSEVLQEFSEKWKKEIGLPFEVCGLFPTAVRRDKLEMLVHAGMNTVTMGVQSGSDRILAFYKRPPRDLIIKGMTIIAEFSKYMTPYYEVIVDNPIETPEDIIDTLNLIYEAPRPFCLLIYSLRIIPNTGLANDLAKRNIYAKNIGEGYKTLKPTVANAIIYMLPFYRPPRWLYNRKIKHISSNKGDAKRSLLFPLCRMLHRFHLVYYSIKSLDFSVFPGRVGWILWKIGLIGFSQRRRMKSCQD